MSESDSTSVPTEPTFEQALVLLEAIVRDLEEGKIGLAESLARYEQGVKLLKQCYTLLENAERRIELLNSIDSRGSAVTEIFDDQAISLAEKAQTRSRRRTKSTPPINESRSEETMDEPGKLF